MLKKLQKTHYSKIIDYDLDTNFIKCIGIHKASSESLSHAVIYKNLSDINSVLHIHNYKLWKESLNILPTTSPDVSYGTPEMAKEISRLLKQQFTIEKKIIIMAGHEQGIIAFGKDIDEAGSVLLSYF